MVLWKSRYCGSVFQDERQGPEPAVQHSRSHLIDIRFELAELGPDADIPHAHRAYVDPMASIRDQHPGTMW